MWAAGGEVLRAYRFRDQPASVKYPVLNDLYNTITVTQSIIYCNTKKKVERLLDLKTRFSATCIQPQ